MDFQPGDPIGPFRVEQLLGRGGSSTVYRANDPRFGGPVAIKVLAAHLAHDGDAVERFVKEARALRMVDDETVVSVFDVNRTSDGQPYMVLQYADRGSLAGRLPGSGASSDELAQLARFFGRSIGALHRRNLVHRDVKPSNVLLASLPEPRGASGHLLANDERLVLGDLGLVKDMSAGGFTRGSGSFAYAAPEQRAVVSRVDRRSDVFGASAVVAEAALGRVRRADESWSDILDALSAARQTPLANVLRVGLADDPDNRMGDIATWTAQVLAALEPGEEAMTAPAARLPVLAAAAVASLLLVGVGWVLWRGSEGTNQDQVAQDQVAGISQQAVPTVAEPTPVVVEPAPVVVEPTVAEPTPVVVESAPVVVEPTVAEPTPVVVAPVCEDAGSRGLVTGLQVVEVTATTVTIAWTQRDAPASIFVGTRYHDNARKLADRYVIEGLEPSTSYEIRFADFSEARDEASVVCGITTSLPGGEPTGLLMPSGLAVEQLSATSATLTWVRPPSGERFVLFRGTLPDGQNFPAIDGDGGAGFTATSYTFENLEPGSRVVLGLRTIGGENQSNLAWVEVEVPQN